MSVLINMEMPTSCYYCPMTNDGFYLCKATSPYKELEDDCEERKPQWCPLVPVPKHGRLGDLDVLITTFCEWGTSLERKGKFVITMAEAKQTIVDIIEDAPTIIPADRREREV